MKLKIQKVENKPVQRKPKKKRDYLSPSAINSYDYSIPQFYVNYILGHRNKTTAAMCLGSAFDSYVKYGILSYLRDLPMTPLREQIIRNSNLLKVGKYDKVRDLDMRGEQPMTPCLLPFNTLEEIFNGQVNEAFRGETRPIVEPLYKDYCKWKGLSSILHRPKNGHLVFARMEDLLLGYINGVPVGGYPDALLLYEDGSVFILDWKVNGYYSKNGIGLKKQPIAVYGNTTGRENIEHGGQTEFSVECNPEYYNQLTTYAEILRMQGVQICGGILHQLAFNKKRQARLAIYEGPLVSTNVWVRRLIEVWGQMQYFTALSDFDINYLNM